ncbi:hypothetical protein AMTR_s00083p00177180 [Amborella trichopoda]|uniref:Uncharacterized protein n=1 Tax=Amborella trichopoda TaxID=13333 RepID=W1P3N9_AMBTC|nr:hypothetical protein AMTR_s00083p00177180 [Amborella trichopoda]
MANGDRDVRSRLRLRLSTRVTATKLKHSGESSNRGFRDFGKEVQGSPRNRVGSLGKGRKSPRRCQKAQGSSDSVPTVVFKHPEDFAESFQPRVAEECFDKRRFEVLGGRTVSAGCNSFFGKGMSVRYRQEVSRRSRRVIR